MFTNEINFTLAFHVRNIFLKPILLLIWKSYDLRKWKFKRDLFGYNVQGLSRATKIESDDSIEKMYRPSWRLFETKSYKDLSLMEKEIKIQKSYPFFIKVIRKEFNKLDKVFCWIYWRKMMLSLNLKLNLKHC